MCKNTIKYVYLVAYWNNFFDCKISSPLIAPLYLKEIEYNVDKIVWHFTIYIVASKFTILMLQVQNIATIIYINNVTHAHTHREILLVSLAKLAT